MTRAPWVLPKPAAAVPGRQRRRRSRPRWAGGWSTERMPAEWTVSLGEANEQLREKYAISRERQDAFAARSHQLADAAWNAGLLRRPRDAGARRRARSGRGDPRRQHPEKLAALKPVVPARRHHHRRQRLAAQRRRLRRAARLRNGRRPHRRLPRWPGSPVAAAYALEPQMFGYAPVEAAETGARAGRASAGRTSARSS